MTCPRDTGEVPLKRLLTLSRDLLQSPSRDSILKLVGRALQELVTADQVLLLLKVGGGECLTQFDQDGFLQPGRHTTDLYRHAIESLHSHVPFVAHEQPDVLIRVAPDSGASGLASLLAYPFPPFEPIGVFAARWSQRLEHDPRAVIPILRHLGELTAAALGHALVLETLEAAAATRTEQARQAARRHADELGRRDSFELELQRIAITDVMTGLLNRRGFFLQAEQSLKIARRRSLASAVIFADIDGLKSVNDSLGHDLGDQLIQDSAAILKASFRDSDIIARLGGDEFAAFTIDSAQPEVILSRIGRKTESLHDRLARPYPIAFSTGIVTCDPTSELSLSNYVSQADTQMYEQKRLRRDRRK